ncbi:phytoene desaturase family protein [Sphingobium sp. EP60837]|uniref:phytoene desaturase family protein n=1 Tax=Sphingobium sp. EP60837 TaxID=1855519 RepID=UPI0007DE20D2|nr:NAD(P)/FAD-dependent oxidoreductase [Sphingobium sp. EP60837]ANI80183.1 Protein p49 [Sphingobium sp. EP60837]
MTQLSDIVAVGSGHNGLIAAAYCAKAGKKVTVLERNNWFGGGCVSRELTVPGFTHDQHSMSHIFIQANPLLKNDELGLLSKYGLKYVYPDSPMFSVFEDGTTLGQYRDRNRTAADIAKFSTKDADAYLKLAAKAAELLPMFVSQLFVPPMPNGAISAMMDQSREGRELGRLLQMSSHDLLCDTFEHDKVRMHFARVAGEALVSPDEKATAIGIFVFVGFMEATGIGVPVGGSGQLTRALIDCIRDHGGEVLSDVDVTKVRTSNGRATSVAAADGREWQAREAVIGAFHPHVLGDIVEGVDPYVDRTAKETHVSHTGCITLHASLSEPLRFRAGADIQGAMIELLPNNYDTLRKSFDCLRYGDLVSHPLIGVGMLTQFDPSRVPPGKSILHSWDYAPYERPDGRSWDEAKEEYGQRMIAYMQKYFENLNEDTILGIHIDSPVDMYRTSPSFYRGDLHGIAETSYQRGSWRPTAELGNYKVPGIEGLYLVGPFQAPGGGVYGAGRATAIKMFDDMGIDMDKVIDK